MRGLFYKLLPYAIGIPLGLLFCFPPAWLDVLGPWQPLGMGAIVLVLLCAFSFLNLLKNFPQNVEMEPLPPGPPPPDIAALLESYQSLGFELVSPPVRIIHLGPSNMLWCLAHRGLRCWGTVFSTGTFPRKVGYDFVSTIEGDRWDLTSIATWLAGTLPVAANDFKQIWPGAAPSALLSFHLVAQDFLETRGAQFALPLLPEGGLAEMSSIGELKRPSQATPTTAPCP